MSWFAAGDVEVASSHGAGNDEGASLDAIWDDSMLGTIQLGDTLHADGGRTSAFDAGSHFVEQIGEVGDFRLARAVLQNRLTFGQGGSHQQIFGSGYCDFVEGNFSAFEAGGAGFYVAVFLRDLRAQLFEAFDVEIDGASADRASTGERDPRSSAAGNQRT